MRTIEEFWLDLRYAARSLGRHPVLAGAVVVTLLLGIGLNSAVFSVLMGMCFRARVEKDPNSFVQLPRNTSLRVYNAYRAQSRSIGNLAAWKVVQAHLDDDSQIDLGDSDDPDHHSEVMPISLPKEADRVYRSEATLGF